MNYIPSQLAFLSFTPCQMLHDPLLEAHGQTPAQRSLHLGRVEAATPGLVTKADPFTRHLYARFLTGELSWRQVRELRAAPVLLGT